MDELLNVKDLTVEYVTDNETVHAVNGISFTLGKGQTIGLVGETGAGKTTTALAIMRLLPDRTGRVPKGKIFFNNQELNNLSEKEMQNVRGGKIAMIFQDPMTSLNPVITIGDQIAEALNLHNIEGRSKDEINKRVDEVLSLVGIQPNRKHEFPHQFSGGMKQRVVIAIALACEPELLIADEPTTALDVTIQAQVISMIRELRDRLGTAMIMITHDLGIVAQTCDNVAVMYAGELIEIGTAMDIFTGKIHHPYTVGLFNSLPSMNKKVKRLTPISGLMPDPVNLPEGCYFSPRCPYVTEKCKKEHPPVYECEGHKISCWQCSDELGWEVIHE